MVFPEGVEGPGEALLRALPARRFGGAASCRSPCGPGCRSSRWRSSATRRPCRSWRRSRHWPRPWIPYVPIMGNMFLGPLGTLVPFPAKIAHPGARPRGTPTCCPTSPATRGAGSWTRPRASAHAIQHELYDMLCHPPQRLVGLMGRRVLVTGLASFWGGRVAQALEQDPAVDVIIGLDTPEPTVQLDRTEFVRTDESDSILSRIVRATRSTRSSTPSSVVDSSQRRRPGCTRSTSSAR